MDTDPIAPAAPRAAPETVAVIDIGASAVRLVVAELSAGRRPFVVEEVVRLGPRGLFGIASRPATGTTLRSSVVLADTATSYRVGPGHAVRPVYFFVVDMSEFSTDKLANRGSAQATAILTNVQDFLINLFRNLNPERGQ